MGNALVIPFGRYKGHTPDEVRAIDPAYLEWMSAQPWFREKFASLYVSIINVHTGEPAETPEHNAMQARFLDDAYVMAFLSVAMPFHRTPRQWADVISGYLDNPERTKVEALRLAVLAMDAVPHTTKIVHRAFEISGIDVWLDVTHHAALPLPAPYMGMGLESLRCAIEIKPTLGDDFPAAIRQVLKLNPPVELHRYGEPWQKILLVGDYHGVGATPLQFLGMARASGISVVFTQQVEEACNGLNRHRNSSQKGTVTE